MLVAGASLAFPSAALADELYADNTGVFADCTQASPCQLSTALVEAASGDTIHVGGGSYAAISLPDGVSVIKESYPAPPAQDTSGPATIGTIGDATPAITVPAGTAPRTIDGFVLRGGAFPAAGTLDVAANVDNLTISGNTFDDTDDGVFVHLKISGGSPRITGNTFSGVDEDIIRRAITYAGTGNPEIDANQIDAYLLGIEISGTAGDFATVDIHDNELTGIYDIGMVNVGIGLWLKHTDGTLTENLIESAPAAPLVEGVDVSSTATSTTPLRAWRNEIYGAGNGFRISGLNPVELRDEVYGNNGIALVIVGVDPVTVTATGITTQSTNPLFYEVSLGSAGSSLTLDSSFIGDNGAQNFFAGGGGTCTSTFSATSDATTGCAGIQAGVAPMFADPSPAANDFHLVPGSPLLDAGNPAPPPAGELDIDGEARALDATPACPLVLRRDIGADELGPAAPFCPPLAGAPGPGPGVGPPTTKKCKKAKKKKKATASKKKKKKRKCKRKKRRKK